MIRFSLLFLATYPLVAEEPAPPVTLDAGNTIQLCGPCPSRKVRAAVTATKFVVQKNEKPVVLEVSSGDVRDQSWKSWFTPSWETTGKGIPVALNLDVSDELRKAGTYTVVLLLRENVPKLKMQVVQAAAQLDVPDKLLIEREQILPWSCCSGTLTPLIVRETTGLAKVSGIMLFNKQAMQGTEGTSGSLAVVDSDKAIVPAGEPGEIHYALKGEFPRGAVTGSAKIVAPQLAQPVALNYEIRTKLHEGWVLAAIALGLGLGYYVRVKLQDRIQLAQARSQAITIAAEVGDHLEDYDDTAKAAVADLIKDLRTAARGSEPAAITTASVALRAKWTTAAGEYKQRRQESSKLLRDLEELLALPWKTPTAVETSLDTARRSAAEAKAVLGLHKADQALAAATELYGALAMNLRNDGLAWQNAAQGIATQLAEEGAPGIPEVVRSQFAATLKNAPPELNRIKDDAPKPEMPAFRQALDDLGVELRRFAELIFQLKLRIEQEWSAFEAAWSASAAHLPHREKLNELKTKIGEFLQDLSAAPANPGALRAALPQRLAEFQASWRTAILSQLPADHAELENIRKLIEDRKFVEAGRAMATAVTNVQATWGRSGRPPDAEPWPTAGLAASASNFITIFGTPEEPDGAIPGLPRIFVENELTSARVMQTVIVGAFTVLWAFTSYAKDFDGTFRGLLTPLFATFLLDISLEGLKNQLKGKKTE